MYFCEIIFICKINFGYVFDIKTIKILIYMFYYKGGAINET